MHTQLKFRGWWPRWLEFGPVRAAVWGAQPWVQHSFCGRKNPSFSVASKQHFFCFRTIHHQPKHHGRSWDDVWALWQVGRGDVILPGKCAKDFVGYLLQKLKWPGWYVCMIMYVCLHVNSTRWGLVVLFMCISGITWSLCFVTIFGNTFCVAGRENARFIVRFRSCSGCRKRAGMIWKMTTMMISRRPKFMVGRTR